MIGIRMLKICGDPIQKSFGPIFRSSLEHCLFFCQNWKKANIVPIDKKDMKQALKNSFSSSNMWEIFEGLLYKNMLSFFIGNDFISQNQSGFKSKECCIKQLFSVTHEIYKIFDGTWEVRIVFLDISIAFDRFWHQGLVLKLKQIGISGIY